MKNILILLFLSLFLGYGCKYFKKSSSRQVDTITADTASTGKEVVDSAAYYAGVSHEVPAPKPAVVKTGTNATKGNYYMIVGCFTVQRNADNYAEKLRGMGYQPQIIPGRNNFQMVAARSYDNYRSSVAEIDKFRNEVSPNAWVYRKK
jgi:hypothetical protein